jgi:3-oxoacyl-[acyl-carrier-protein] synthase II
VSRKDRPSYVDHLESLSKTQLVLMLARARQEETQGVGVIGMGCRFPGGIGSPDAFWDLLRHARQVPMNGAPSDSLGRPRWNLEAPDLAPLAPLLRRGAYLDDIDLFDADYFGMSEEESNYLDPQQRLLLEVSVQALADANITRAELRRKRVGIFVGVGFMEYGSTGMRNGISAAEISAHMLQGNTASAASGRLGLMLGTNGPAYTLDTASSTALSAVHLAAASLRRGDCELAIVGACHLLLSPLTTLMLSRAGALSPTGESRPFSVGANGHVRAEGCGVFILKRQAACLADHDRPYAWIKGSAVHQHGDRLALSVASAAGQRTVIELALRNAGVEPHDVQYVEAQANGSQLGGVVEVEALVEAYDRRDPARTPLVVGSCKANLGYLEVASGAPALMKTVLALAHGEIPPHRGADEPDPAIAWGALSLNAKPLAWPEGRRRLAGISGFGMNGINAHVIVEAPAQRAVATEVTAPATDDTPALFVLSAHSESALRATAARLHKFLASSAGWQHGQVCRTLAEGRDRARLRVTRVVRSSADLLDLLATVSQLGAAAEPAGQRTGVFLALPDLAHRPADGALRAGLQRCPELHHRMVAQAAALGVAWPGDPQAGTAQDEACSLAWSLACLDLLADLGVTLQGCSAAGAGRHLVLRRFVGALTSLQACEQWMAGQRGEPVASAVWQTELAGDRVSLRAASGGRVSDEFAPTPQNPFAWLQLMATQVGAGVDLDMAAWFGPRKAALMRLPGPVLVGKHHWPESLRWH